MPRHTITYHTTPAHHFAWRAPFSIRINISVIKPNIVNPTDPCQIHGQITLKIKICMTGPRKKATRIFEVQRHNLYQMGPPDPYADECLTNVEEGIGITFWVNECGYPR
jgi:hypothetical protein